VELLLATMDEMEGTVDFRSIIVICRDTGQFARMQAMAR
jgi:hypothetical protein